MATKSGLYWVTWANAHAKNSKSLEDLKSPFKDNVKSFKQALETAGAKVTVKATKRSDKRAYLFHWAWKIGLGKSKASEATTMPGVDIQWDHGDETASKNGAKAMISGFGLAVPPASTNPPALGSKHISGTAVDMDITWNGTISVKKKDGTQVSVAFMPNVNNNTTLHQVGESYGVKKLKTDAPHWSDNGH